MNIKLTGNIVDSLKVGRVEADSEYVERVNVDYQPLFSDDDPKEFAILFDLSIATPEGVAFDLAYFSLFTSDEEISDEMKENSRFFKVNAPAIAFPFLRAYVSNFLLSSGFQPLMLPTINFVEFSKNKEEALAAAAESVGQN